MKENHHRVGICLFVSLVVAGSAAPALAEESDGAPEPNWKNKLGLSYVGTSGNTDTSSLGLDFSSERRPAPWGLNLIATFTRAEDGGVVTAEQYLVGARASRELDARWSLFAGLSWARDTFGGFDNRYIAEAGAEVLAVKTDRHTLSFDAGLTWTSEDRITADEADSTVDWIGGVAGLKWEWTFSESASLSQRVLYYPNFDDSADWRVASDTAVTADLTKLLALQVGYLVRYRNRPIDNADGVAREKTDTTTKVSVVMSF